MASGIGSGNGILPSLAHVSELSTTDKEAPVKEGGIRLFHNGFLGVPNIVPLLCVRDGPRLLDFTQLLQAIIETLSHRKDCIKKSTASRTEQQATNKGKAGQRKKSCKTFASVLP